MSAPRKPDSIAEAHDQASELVNDLLDQLETLRLVYVTVDRCEDHMEPTEDLSAARNQLGRLVMDIRVIHNRVELLSSMLFRSQESAKRKRAA